MEIRPLAPDDRAALERFVERVPEGDRTFFKEDVTDPDVVATWFRSPGTRFVAVEADAVLGYVALSPLQGWSSHVGEIRVVVDADARGRGIGRALVRCAVLAALDAGLTKMMIEVVADQEPAIAMYRSLARHLPALRMCASVSALLSYVSPLLMRSLPLPLASRSSPLASVEADRRDTEAILQVRNGGSAIAGEPDAFLRVRAHGDSRPQHRD